MYTSGPVAVIAFNADSFRPDVTASDSDIATYFAAKQADFRIPEKRKAKYVLVDIDVLVDVDVARVVGADVDDDFADPDVKVTWHPSPHRIAPRRSRRASS